ncbi:MAG: hypothetical protein M3332_10080 [Actinomycetota bacterium]|nr:hypothetical protein [Actinomycetota bacterium]
MSEKQYCDKIATIKKQQGTEEKAMAKDAIRGSQAPRRRGQGTRQDHPSDQRVDGPHASAQRRQRRAQSRRGRRHGHKGFD